jgi:carbon storage regulator
VLILNVKEGEKVLIGENISVLLVELRRGQIRLGIEAPKDVLVLRDKLAKREEA